MKTFQFIVPKMGESISEVTILTWRKKVGDAVEEEEIILELATDKVDSDVPSPVKGIITEIKYQEGDVAKVGDVLAIIEISNENNSENKIIEDLKQDVKEIEIVEEKIENSIQLVDKMEEVIPEKPILSGNVESIIDEIEIKSVAQEKAAENRLYSPLVMNIAKVENISAKELDGIKGGGQDGRVTKEDVLDYLKNRKTKAVSIAEKKDKIEAKIELIEKKVAVQEAIKSSIDEVVEMDRMRKLIAKNMVESVKNSPHVTSIVETDMTNIVNWRAKNKKVYEEQYGVKLTYMPFIIQAIARALLDFPMINISVDKETIIKKSKVNIGIATALPNGNLIVPVIKDADRKNLLGLAKDIEELVEKARTNKLKLEDVEGGTYTVSNIGSFGNIIGTPIIVQPQVAILAVGVIEKKPSVIESPDGDMIAIRHKMYLSHTYDHRVVDGMLGGLFVKKVSDYLSSFSNL